MAKVTGDEKIPKRIDDYIVYRLNGEMIMRHVSGFTSKKILNDSKYSMTRQNANEFGRVSSLCKKMRLGLAGVLPKKNNLAVCNALVKHMRSLMVLDGESVRGKRQLWKAFLNEKAKELMIGYDFNPNAQFTDIFKKCFKLDETGFLQLTDLNIRDVVAFPAGSDCIGIRLHHLDFEFTEGGSSLCSSEWLFLNSDSTDDFVLHCKFPEHPSGVVFSVVEIQFYNTETGGFVPLADDGGKMVSVVGCK